MKNLEYMHANIKIDTLPGFIIGNDIQNMLLPLKAVPVGQIKVFRVYFRWDMPQELDNFLEDAPFVIAPPQEQDIKRWETYHKGIWP